MLHILYLIRYPQKGFRKSKNVQRIQRCYEPGHRMTHENDCSLEIV